MNNPTLRKAAPSTFARTLSQLLDETGFYSRSEWASFLGISTSAISQWVHDKTVPRADLLRMILDVLQTRGGVAAASALRRFEQLEKKSATEISPLGVRMAPTLRSYLDSYTFAKLGQKLRGLQPDQQIDVLTSGGWPSLSAGRLGSKESEQAVFPDLVSIQKGMESKVVPWERLLDGQHCLIVAAPGSGKSRLLSALVDRCSETARASAVRVNAVDVYRGSTFSDLFEQIPSNSLLLIDGLDELGLEARPEAAKQIVDGCHRVSAMRCVVASRPTPELALLEKFETFSLAPLSRLQIVQFLFKANEEVRSQAASSAELYRFICHLYERPSLRKFFANPLFLAVGWELFKYSGVTPFSESQILGEFVRSLLERDYHKEVVRVRRPWASPQCLLSLLGTLSLQLLKEEKAVFDAEQASTWIGARFPDVPVLELLSLLEMQGFLRNERGAMSFVHKALQDYFAALNVVEGADSVLEHLVGWRHKEDVREVFRLACGITSDATPLLKGVIGSIREGNTSRCALLAEILAQPIAAERTAIEESCETLIGWLDKKLANWSIKPSLAKSIEGEASWEMLATGQSVGEAELSVRSTLSSIHRARSGLAHVPLRECMKGAKSVILPEFADCMTIEGKLEVTLSSEERRGILRATVAEPMLQ